VESLARGTNPSFQSLRQTQGSSDRARYGVIVGETLVELTRTEYPLLELLMRNPLRVLTYNLICDRIWGYDFGPTSRALRAHVVHLRLKPRSCNSVVIGITCSKRGRG